VFVLDLVAALLDALRRAPLLAQAGKFPAAERLQREVARGLAAGVEMLVEPALGRHEQAAGAPFVALDIFSLGPHDRETFALQDDHVRARAVAVRLLVGADGEL